jgi:putative ABC transport system permease protein
MLNNYIKISYRNLLKNKVFSLVNIFGLAIGLAACFFIFEYVHFESSYDNYHPYAKDIYRVNLQFTGSIANLHANSTNHPGVGFAMKQDLPEVENFSRVANPVLFAPGTDIRYKDVAFNEEKLYLVDPSFIKMFDVPFLKGDPKTALNAPGEIIISATAARKYFGDEDPVGKTITLNGTLPLSVKGVFKDVPENSHLRFNMLMSMSTAGGVDYLNGNWGWPEFYTYVQLRPGTDPAKVAAKLPALIEKYAGAKMKELNYGMKFTLQPLEDIHLLSGKMRGPEPNGSDAAVRMLAIIGILILLIAWINYINLSTAKNIERAKEVGLRKVVGAEKWQVISQFMIESLIINLLALFVASLLIMLCFPYFGIFVGRELTHGSASSNIWHAPKFWLALAGVFFSSAFIVGAYPAFVLSSYKPVTVLKGKFFMSARGLLLRKALVSFQFVLSLLLIAGTITVYKQLRFMQHGELGYDPNQVLIVKAPVIFDPSLPIKKASFAAAIKGDPTISNITATTDIPGKRIVWDNSIRKATDDKTHNLITDIMEVDTSFIPAYRMQLLAGRNFTTADTANIFQPVRPTVRVILNEKVIKMLGFKDAESAVHQSVTFLFGSGDVQAEIIGVIKNYHQRSMKEDYDPVLLYTPSPEVASSRYFSINLNTQHVDQQLASIKSIYKSVFPSSPFEYFFLDDYFNQQYQADQQFGRVFGLFTILAILVACLGLLGLSSFMIKLRTKEIGIRKVLGASVPSLLLLFSKDFIRLVVLASLIALPVSWFLISKWLEDFAFHIQLNWMIFVLPPLLLAAISVATISLQSVRAALVNPIRSLKTE